MTIYDLANELRHVTAAIPREDDATSPQTGGRRKILDTSRMGRPRKPAGFYMRKLDKKAKPFAEKIIADVARGTLATPEAIKGRCRELWLVKIRWSVIRKLNQAGLSCKQIGRCLNRHHTAILHALRNAE